MDNANEITADFTHKEVELFLGDELKNYNDENIVSYNLEEEYAKTKNNKAYFVWILLGICFFVVGLGTTITTKFLTDSNHRISININSFDDLNLRSLLSSVGQTRSQYKNAVKTKESLEDELKNELNQAKQKQEMELFTLKSVSKVASKDSIQKRKNQIDENYEESVKKLHEKYDSEIASAKEKIKHFQEQMETFDSGKIAQADSQESSIDSTKQLHDLQMKNQADKYEAKIKELRELLITQQIQAAEEQKKAVEDVRNIYQAKIDLLDPKAREENAAQNKIILDIGINNNSKKDQTWSDIEKLAFTPKDYTSSSKAPEDSFSQALSKSQRELAELRTIAKRFRPIPMENSIRDYVPAMVRQSFSLAQILAESGKDLQTKLDSLKNSEKAKNIFIDQQLSQSGHDGLIISSIDEDHYLLYICQGSQWKLESDSEIPVHFYNGSKMVLTGTAYSSEGTFIAKIPPANSLHSSAEIYYPKAGDKIKLEIKTK